MLDRDALFEQNREWAAKLARDFARRKLPPSFDPRDLEQEARIECWKQAQKYEESRGVPFQAFAYLAVIGAVKMACRRRFWSEAVMPEVDPDTIDERPAGEAALQDEIERAATDQQMCLELAAIESALAVMPWAEAFLIRRIYLQGADPAEIAPLWGQSVARISRRLSAAVRMLKARIVQA